MSMGTKQPSETQLYKMLRYFDKIYLSLDGDVSVSETLKAKKAISEYLDVEVIKLPEGKDPNDLTPDEVENLYFKKILRRPGDVGKAD